MDWTFPGVLVVTCIHVLAIVAGRSTGSVPHRIAFASGIFGLLSIPLLLLAVLTSFCIAGGCRDGTGAADLAAIAFVAIALVSSVSLVVIGVRRKRA